MSSVLASDTHEGLQGIISRARDAFSNKNYSDAEALTLQALRESEQLNQPSTKASLCLLLAEIFIKQSKIDEALKPLDCALSFLESVGEREGLKHALSLLGKVEYYKRNYPLAFQRFESVLKLGDELADEFNFTAHYFNAIIYLREHLFEQSLASGQRALLCAQALKSPHKVAQVCVHFGNLYNYQGNCLEAFSQFRQAEFISQSHGYSDIEAVALQNLASLLTSIGDINQSLTIHHRLIEYYEKVGDQRKLGLECLNTARSYFIINDFEHAKHLCERAIELLSPIDGEEDNSSAARLTLAEIYLHRNQLDLAISTSREVVSFYEQSLNKEFLPEAYSILGNSLYKSRDVQGAITYMKKAVEFSQHIQHSHRHAECCIALSNLFLAEEDFDAALSHFEHVGTLCEKQSFKSLLPKIYLGLSQIYDKRGDLSNAYNFYRKYHESSQDVFNLELEKNAQRLSLQYDLRQKEQDAKKEREKNELLSKANQELQEANRLKNEFLSIATHDLKNPLQSILGFANLIETDAESLEEAKSYAAIISRSASHMVNLVKSLLETAAISSNALTFKLEKANLSDLLKRVIDDFLPALQSKSQTISFQNAQSGLVLVDIDKMHAVFSNLISNAIKYSPKGTQIAVQIVQLAQSGFRISIKDEGQGLSESDKENLFGQFQRLSSRPTGGEGSTGLGLWICKGFVEKHGGKIWAESEGKGKGTTFFVELPATT
ncbi:MAG: tetratricopeptide repeat-containing sensor histidine kinase [Chlorobiales bacterium]